LKPFFPVVAILLMAVPVGGAGEAVGPDRSMLWKADEAFSHLVGPDLAGRAALDDTTYGYDVVHMALDLLVDTGADTIGGQAAMTVVVTGAALDEILIDLTDSLKVGEARVNGLPVVHAHGGDIVSLPVTPPAVLGDSLAVQVTYSGHPPDVGNKGMKFQERRGLPHVYVLSTPYSTPGITVIPMSSYWRPCKDVPNDKSTFSLNLTVDEALVGCSNGVMTGNVDNGDGTRTFTWEHDYAVAPYLVALGVSDYSTIEDTYTGSGDSTLVQHFVFPDLLADAVESFNITVPAIEFLASIYGEYPFLGEKFGHFTIDAGVAVEEQTLVAYPEVCVDGAHYYDWLLVHELAHQWWGDCITCNDWKEVWLNEGFASYSEALWKEHTGGKPAYRLYMDAMDNGPYSGTIYDPPYVWSSIVYDKGAWVLHMLRWIMRDEGFFQMLLDYRAAHEYSNVVTADLVSIAEAVYGGDLSWFFDAWIYHEGRPDYEYWWEYSGTGPYTVNVYVRQVQSSSYPTYKMPLRLRVDTTGPSEGFTVWDSLRTQAFVVSVPNEPTGVVCDPKHKILGAFTEVSGSGAGERACHGTSLEQNVPNPFTSVTVISFETSKPQTIALRVFDIEGRMVRTLERGRVAAGLHRVTWDGNADDGRPVAPGVYFCQLVGPDGVQRRRMVRLD
jgi:aminopeptidase N